MKAVLAAGLCGLVGAAGIYAASSLSEAGDAPRDVFQYDGRPDGDDLQQYARLIAPRSGTARGGGGCAQGLAAFTATVQPFVRQNCVHCHSTQTSNPHGPTFASEDASANYTDLLRRVNFNDLSKSRLVVTGGNHHCLDVWGFECNINSPAQVLPIVQAWKDQGQAQCPEAGKFFSTPLPVPADLPHGEQFVKMRFSLASLGTSYAGVELQFEIQKFADASPDYPGAYRIRKPRLVTPRKNLRVAGIRILVNGLWDPLADRFTAIDRGVGTQAMGNGALDGDQFPALASDALIVLQDRAQGDAISVSFDALDVLVDPPTCAALPLFKTQVYPVLQTRACFHCHGGSGVDPRAKAVLDLSGSVETVCARALERSDLALPTASPWVAFPFRGVFGHPRLIPTASEVFPSWSQWMNEEKNLARSAR